jgi:hypothetical protein
MPYFDYLTTCGELKSGTVIAVRENWLGHFEPVASWANATRSARVLASPMGLNTLRTSVGTMWPGTATRVLAVHSS